MIKSPPQILITGTNGSLGKSLMKFFQKNYHVIPLLRSYNNRYVVEKLEFNSDLILIHAGYKTPTNSFIQNDSYIDNIVRLEEIIKQLNLFNIIPYVIFTSSMSVYSKKSVLTDITEDSLISEDDKYGISKYLCEKLLIDYRIEKRIKGYINLRLPGVLAPESAANSKNFISLLIEDLLKGKDLDLFNKNKMFNNFIIDKSIAQFIEQIINLNMRPSITCNLASQPPVKLIKLVDYIKDLISSNSKIEWVGNSRQLIIRTDHAMSHGFKPWNPYYAIDTFLSDRISN